jgi:hypothetical protein
LVIGVVAAALGAAGDDLLIPTLVLLFGADIKLTGSLSLTVPCLDGAAHIAGPAAQSPAVPKAPALPGTAAPLQATSGGVPWTMIVLAGSFGATWFVSTAFAAHLPQLLEALGATPNWAVAAAALVSPSAGGLACGGVWIATAAPPARLGSRDSRSASG